ncbi:winged helix-turn-helix domain-containing protein [Streptomyces sp. NPDC088755]|uniref:helix-turn-helix domain-containing protein n=2 Tax=unclassified Streptomyces TaxID=2593676 RepID=UPI00380C3C53
MPSVRARTAAGSSVASWNRAVDRVSASRMPSLRSRSPMAQTLIGRQAGRRGKARVSLPGRGRHGSGEPQLAEGRAQQRDRASRRGGRRGGGGLLRRSPRCGLAGVASKGSPGRPRLSSTQITRLERELERGPLVHGWTDQQWTLARVKAMIGRLFHVSCTVEGTWRLFRRHGWSWQQPVRRAIERDDDAVRCGGGRSGRG